MWRSCIDTLVRFVLPAVGRGARGIVINNHIQNATEVRAQVHALASVFDFIEYDELGPRLFSKPWKKPFCLLTFDDGKAVNAEETAPELLKLGVPAVFFLTTGMVGTDEVLWFDRLTALRRAGVPNLPDLSFWKTLPWRERDRKLDDLCRSCGVEADRSDPTVRMMSWGDAVQMKRNGFEIGSHSVCHAILTTETPEEAFDQLKTSAQSLVSHGLRARTFAFPNGNCSAELISLALEAGFESTFSTVPVWLGKNEALSCLPRLYVKESADAFYIHMKLLAARAGYILKNPNGEGRCYRRSTARRISAMESREKPSPQNAMP